MFSFKVKNVKQYIIETIRVEKNIIDIHNLYFKLTLESAEYQYLVVNNILSDRICDIIRKM